jgi:hypothetical protein
MHMLSDGNGKRELDLEHTSAAHQMLRREVNERIRKLANGNTVGDQIDVFCECGRDECAERLSVSMSEYERVRRFSTHFIVLEGHDVLESERVVDECGGFMVVEKTGSAGIYAVRVDPRRQRVDV